MISKIYANGKDEIEFLENLKKRSGETNKKVEQVVSEIIENVKENGDKAVNDYTLKFDGSLPEYSLSSAVLARAMMSRLRSGVSRNSSFSRRMS